MFCSKPKQRGNSRVASFIDALRKQCGQFFAANEQKHCNHKEKTMFTPMSDFNEFEKEIYEIELRAYKAGEGPLACPLITLEEIHFIRHESANFRYLPDSAYPDTCRMEVVAMHDLLVRYGQYLEWCVERLIARERRERELYGNTADFDESKINRDDDGKFASKGGGSGGKDNSSENDLAGNGNKKEHGGAVAMEKDEAPKSGKYEDDESYGYHDYDRGKVAEEFERENSTRKAEQNRGLPVKEPYSDQTPETAPIGSKREYYVIGERPLGESSIIAGPLKHEHFIADDGTNFGRFDHGITSDEKSNWGKYRYHDKKKYDAALIEEASRIYAEQRKDMQESYEEYGGEGNLSEYDLGMNNCQHYTRDVVEIAGELAKRHGRPLVVNE